MKNLLTSLRVFVTFLILLGICYPLLITGIGQMMMPFEANGSLIESNGKIIGSELIGQQFTTSKYFHTRPSAIEYNAEDSGASNLGPSNPKLFAILDSRLKQIRTENNLPLNTFVPADMVLASASGLDPHISLENAEIQAPRIAKARNLTQSKVESLILESIDSDFIGIWGHAGVNVLKLNLMLDEFTDK